MESYIIKTNWSMEHVATGRFATPVTRKLNTGFQLSAETLFSKSTICMSGSSQDDLILSDFFFWVYTECIFLTFQISLNSFSFS